MKKHALSHHNNSHGHFEDNENDNDNEADMETVIDPTQLLEVSRDSFDQIININIKVASYQDEDSNDASMD